jgi:hypothetical protein
VQWPKCTQCTAQHQQKAQQCAQGTYCGGWRRCACLDVKTRVFAVGTLASTTCNNFIADLLFLSEVSHSLLVAGVPCVHPCLGESALPPPPGLRPPASSGDPRGSASSGEPRGSGARVLVGGSGAGAFS